MVESLEELQRQIEEYRTILDSSPILVWYKNREGVHLRVNRPAAALEGLPVTAIEGCSHFDLYPQEQAEAFHADDQEVILTGQAKTGIIEQHTSPLTGETVWLETSKMPFRDANGDIAGVIAFAVDITPQKQREEALRADLLDLRILVEGGGDYSDLLARIDKLLAMLD